MTLRTPAFNDAKSYGFEWLRALLEMGDVQEGVYGAGDLKVTAAGAGGQRVDIAAGTALVKGDSGVPGTGLTQGLFMVVNDALVANAVTLNASDATNPRIDQIVLRVRDSSDLGSGADDAVFEVVTGAPTAGATLDNRNGAGALPADRVRLADVLVPAASSAVVAGNVRDRRPWARGAYKRVLRNAGAYALTTTLALIDSTNVDPRIECSGAPLRVAVKGLGNFNASAAAQYLIIQPWIDDALPPTLEVGAIWHPSYGATNYDLPLMDHWIMSPAPGSHKIGLAARFSGGTAASIYATNGNPLTFEIEELVRQNADNT